MPEKIDKRTFVVSVLTLFCIILNISGFILYRQYDKMRTSEAWEEHSYDVISAAQGFYGDSQRMLNLQRSYLITGLKEYEELYNKSTVDVRGQLKHLASLLNDNPSQLQHVEQMTKVFDRLQAMLDEKLRERKKYSLEKIANLNAINVRELSIVLVDETNAFLTEEKHLLQARNSARQNAERNFHIVLFSGAGATVFLLLMVNVFVFLLSRRLRNYSKDLEVARDRSEAANLAKSEFLANMSHEIRTPMNAVIGISNILMKSDPISPRQKELLQTLLLSADALLALINDLLDIAKIETRSVELEALPFSLTQLLQEVISMTAVRVKEKGLSFTCEDACAHDRIFVGDPVRLRQIILNLCSNAVKFTEMGGVHVGVTCDPVEDGREIICISVTDTGIGIAPEKQEVIFNKFVQADTSINRKYGGTGLGLAITKTLVELMGGSLSLRSMPGEGSTFTVCLPLVPQTACGQQKDKTDFVVMPFAKSGVEGEQEFRILLVEDYAPNVVVAQAYLDAAGYVYDVAHNGVEALDMAKKNTYVAILMDVQMHGMNGFEATRLIREFERQNGRAPAAIIGMTAHALIGDRERCIGSGMDDYVSKPFNPEELMGILDRYREAMNNTPKGS